jgi:hypothetical protein
MKNTRSRSWLTHLSFTTILLVLLMSTTGCQGAQPVETLAPEWVPFVEMARQAGCADIRNRLFVIDQTLVLVDHVGNCADASYSQTLFGKTIDQVLCVNHDSIAGPIKNCSDPSYQALFDTIITHLDEPDLGLGTSHTVQQLPL